MDQSGHFGAKSALNSAYWPEIRISAYVTQFGINGTFVALYLSSTLPLGAITLSVFVPELLQCKTYTVSMMSGYEVLCIIEVLV